MAAGAGQRRGLPPSWRAIGGKPLLWLALFAALLVAIFVVAVVAQGIGGPSVPAGDAAIIKGAPAGEVTISNDEAERALDQQIEAVETEGKGKAPKPGSKKYGELREAAFEELLQLAWIRGQADEEGIKATPKQIEQELTQIKKTNFPTPKAYKEFLDKTHLTQQDVDDRVEQQILGAEIQEKVKGAAPVPTQADIQAYYDQEKSKQFTTPASRDVRVIVNKDKAKVEAADKMLAADSSPKVWNEAAKKYSSDPTTKATGGLQKGVTEEFVKGRLKAAIFDGPTGELSDVISYQKNFLLIEPVKVNPESVKPLSEVRAQLRETLTAQKQEEFLSEFVSDYNSRWQGRTYCSDEYATKNCANVKSSGHPETASPACYEANPKTPAKECPAPVVQNQPAVPGSVSVTKPEGERLAQRPRPDGLKEGAEAGAQAQAIE